MQLIFDMKNKVLFLFLMMTSFGINAQKFEIKNYQKTPETFQHLLKSNDYISKNDTLNELIVDLVEPQLSDSIIYRKKQRKIKPYFLIYYQ